MIYFLATLEIQSVFHYIPLHESKSCSQYNRFSGEDKYTTIESERLLRLPLYYELSIEEVKHICNEIGNFFK